LLTVLSKAYTESVQPTEVLKLYLQVFTTGATSTSHGAFNESKFDDRRAFLSPIKPLFEMFGMDAIVFWTAVLLKKRVVVYSSNLAELQRLVRSFPLLGSWHRMDWSILRPLVRMEDIELDDLKTSGVYVAGCTDSKSANLNDLYDLYVNLDERSFAIAEHAQEAFTMSKFHKEVAREFATAADEQSEQAVIKTIAAKTQQIIGQLKKLKASAPDQTLTLEYLKEKGGASTGEFFYSVCVAEKLIAN
jgi:Stabilization of polarity axis